MLIYQFGHYDSTWQHFCPTDDMTSRMQCSCLIFHNQNVNNVYSVRRLEQIVTKRLERRLMSNKEIEKPQTNERQLRR